MFSKKKFDLRESIYAKAETNAESGLIQAKLELRHHTLLLEQLKEKVPPNEEEKETLEREIKLTKEAIERDKKTINNWETQLTAIAHERSS